MVDGEAASVSNWERGDLNTIVAEEANPVVAPDKACVEDSDGHVAQADLVLAARPHRISSLTRATLRPLQSADPKVMVDWERMFQRAFCW
jgi:hypothetical protein